MKRKNVMDKQTRGHCVDYAGQESKADKAVDQVLESNDGTSSIAQ